MATKTVTIRMPEDQAAWLSEQGGTLNQVIIDLLDNVRYSRAYSLKEIKGKFTSDEWKFFADSLNGTLVNDQFRYNKGALIAHCEDSEELEGTATKHNVVMNVLKEKINSLTSSQIEALYSRVEQFWRDPVDLEQWANY